jgi:hypothetical protein
MVEAHHEIAELDLNPVMATPEATLIVDARVRVDALPPKAPWPSTWTTSGTRPDASGTE